MEESNGTPGSQETRAKKYRDQTQINDLKQHADKIIQGIKKIGPNHAKRAIWELFQNAVDLSPNSEISIGISDSELTFSHNGVPFTMHTLDCLFTQVSSKTLKKKKLEREGVDPIGQYGTGFMTSHSFGDVVKVSGAIKDDFIENDNTSADGHIKFENLIIDRSTQDWEILCNEISGLRKIVEGLLDQELNFQELPDTVFKFEFNNGLNKARALAAIESLKTILPYVMIFNDRLKKVSITDIDGNLTSYSKDDTEERIEDYYTKIIRIDEAEKQINYLKTDRLIIALPFHQYEGELELIGTANELSDLLPRLFLFYPLIGTENFGFNFVIHSKNYQPTEPRDGLHLSSQNEKNDTEEKANQKLMEEASNLIFDFLDKNLSRIQNPHLLAEINFSIDSDDIDLNNYFIGLKENWTTKFRALPFVETQSARIAAQDAIFLDSKVIDGADTNTLQAIYNIIGKFFTNLPKPELIPFWTRLTDEWDITGIERIGFAQIADKIEAIGSSDSFEKAELLLLYKEMILKGEGELFANKGLLPNIKTQFKKQGELSRSVELSDELILIADVINPKIPNRQIDPDFLLEGLEFESFGRKNYMELINASLDENIKDGTRSHELPENYLSSLMHYGSIVTKIDSTSVPLNVIKLIADHYNVSLTQSVLPTVDENDKIDPRKGQFDLFKVYLNDISDQDNEWVENNIDSLAKVLKQAFSYSDIKKLFLRYNVFPNQLFELKPIISLNKDNRIPDFIKLLYNHVVKPLEPVNSKLAHEIIQDLYDEMKVTNSIDLTRQIEQIFFGESGIEIRMESHPFRPEIIDIIRNFKSKNELSLVYERNFPVTHRNKSGILVQLADGESSFTILSQAPDVIKKLASIADHPDLDNLLKLGEDALRKKRQDEAEMKYKKKIGNHLEEILISELSDVIPEKITAQVKSEQDGQDLIIYINDNPVYFIEVKSKWLETTPIRISRNQTIRAFEEKQRYALCSINMTKYDGPDREAVESIDVIEEFMNFNSDIGEHVEHLISIYHETREHDKFRLDGDYRTLIPAKYIKEGSGLKDFVIELISYLKKEYAGKPK